MGVGIVGLSSADRTLPCGAESATGRVWFVDRSWLGFVKLAIALSGGGVRAAVFHLGVLGRLAHARRLEEVAAISSVSGGSLAVGLVMAHCQNQWPNGRRFLFEVVPRLHDLMVGRDLQRAFIAASLCKPWRMTSGRAWVLADVLRRVWHIEGELGELPPQPIWTINATCYQTGKNWRFERDVMGDYQTRYVRHPRIALASVLAASAAVPGLIGPLTIDSRRHRWSADHDHDVPIEPKHPTLQLWDGGVYDNLGVEALFKPGSGLIEGIDTLIVSDASRPLGVAQPKPFWRLGSLASSLRLIDMATDQVRSVRARTLIDHFRKHPGSGTYLRMGKRRQPDHRLLSGTRSVTMTAEEVRLASNLGTTLRKLTSREFSRLFRHGYEVAEATLAKRLPTVLAAAKIQPKRVA